MSINNAVAKPHHQSGPDLIDVGHDARVTIPGGHFLLTAQFHRQGGDLLLVGNDGHEVLVRGFFDRADPPDLMTEEGGVIPPSLAARLAGPTAPGQYAQDGQQAQATAIGVVEKADGTVTVHHANGTTEVVGKGATVFQGDVIETSKDGSVGIIFADRSTFSLGHGGRMVMDELVYDPQAHTGRSAFSVVQGTFSFVSGQIAKSGPDAMSVKTPVMTIGIRGTTVAGQASAEGSENTVSLLNDSDGGVGQIVISNGAGSQVLTSSGQTLQISSSFQAPPPPVILPPAQIQQMYQSAVDARPPQPTQAPRLPTPSEPGGQPGQQGQTGQQQQQQGQQQGTQQGGEKAAGSGAAQGGTGSSVLDNVKQLGDTGTQQGDNTSTTPLKPDTTQTDLPKNTTSPPIPTVPVTPITVVTNPVPTPPVSTPTPVPPVATLPPVQTPTPTPPPPTKPTTSTTSAASPSTLTVSGNNVTLVAGSADPVVTVGSYLSQVQASNPAATLAATNWTVMASGLANTIQAAPVANGTGSDVFYAGTASNPGSSNPTLSFALDSAKETFAFARNGDGLSAASVTGTGLKATQLVGFHHVIGGSGGNTFNIGSGVGTDGVVTIEGGSGQDKASFAQDTDHLVFLGDGSNLQVSGNGTSLVLSGVERVFGSNHGDTLVGGSADFRVFAGGAGADVLSAGSGNKTLYADWLGDNATLTLGSTTALNIGSGIPLDQSANGRWQVSLLSSAGGPQYYLYDTQGGTASIHLNVDNNHNALPVMASVYKGSMEALSGNGQYFLYVVEGETGIWSGAVVMRDLVAGTAVKLQAPHFSGQGQQQTVALSYDGTLAAIADYNGSTSSTVWIIDTRTGQIVQQYTVDSLTGGFQLGAIRQLQFSHNNNILVIQDTNGAVAQLGVHSTSTSVSPTDGGTAAVISSDGVWAVMQDAAGNVVSHKTDGSATTTIALADTANEYSHVTIAGNSRFIAYWQQIGVNGSDTTEALMVYDRLSGSSAQALTQVLTGGDTASSLPDLVFSEDGRSIYLHGSSSESVMLNPYASINSFNTLMAGTGTDTLFGGMALDGTAVLIQGGQGLEVHAGNTLVGANGGFTTLQGGGGSTRFVAGFGTESFIGGGLRSQQVVDFSNLSQDVFVDVRSNAFSSTANQAILYTHNSNSVVASDYISGIANVIGSQGNNTFVGSNSAETFVGGGGNNTFDGHGGADVYYFGAHTNVLDLRGNAFHGETVIDTAVNGASNYIKPMDDVGGFTGSERVGNDLVVSFDPSGGGGSITYKDYFAASNHNTLTVLGNNHDSAFVKDMQGTAVSASFNDGLAQSYQKVVGTTGSEIFTGATSSGPTDNVIMISSASVLADNSTYTKTGGDFIVGGANNILLGSGESSAYFNHLSSQTDTQAGGVMSTMGITFDLVADNRSSSTMASTLHLDGQLFAAIFQKAIIGSSTTYMYGVSDIYGSNNGDTVLGGSFDDGSGGNWWQQTYYAGHGANTIYDLSTPSSNYGITTLMADYSMSGTGIVANFASTWSPASYTYAGTGDVVSGLSTGTVVHDGVTDHLFGVHTLGGSAYDDTITSGQGGAVFMSSRGSDYYDSEGGLANGRPADLMDYSDSSSVVIINLGASQAFSYQLNNGFTWSGTLNQGQAAHDFTSTSPYIDTLHNVERISLGRNSGTLIGDGANTWMDLSESTSSGHPTVTVDLSNNTVGGFGGTDYVSGVVGFAAGDSNAYFKLDTNVTSNLVFEGDTGTATLDLNDLHFVDIKQSVTPRGPHSSLYNGTITLDNGHTVTYHNISALTGLPSVLANSVDGGTYLDVSTMDSPVIDLTNGTVTAGGFVYTIIGSIVTNQNNPGVIQIKSGTNAIITGTLAELQGVTTNGNNGGGGATFVVTDTTGITVDDDLFSNHFYSIHDGKIYGLTAQGNATVNLGSYANDAQMTNINYGSNTTEVLNLSGDFHRDLFVFAGQNTTLNLAAGSSDANLSVYAYRSDLSHDTLTGSTGNNTLVLKAGSDIPMADENAFVHMTKFQTIAVEDTAGISQLELGTYASAMADRNLTIDLSANHHEANVKLVLDSGIDTTANHLFVKLGTGFNWVWTSNSANLTVDSSLGGMDIVQVGGIRSDFVHAQTAGHSITLVNTNGTDGTVTLMDGAEVCYNDSNLYLLAASGQNGTINAFADIQQGLHGFMVGSGNQLIGSPTATALGTLSFNGSDWTYQGTSGSSQNGMETFLLQDQAGGTHTVNLSVGFDPGGVNSYGTETVTEALTMNAGSHIYIDSQVDSSWHHDELTVSGSFTAGGELDVRLTSDSTSLGPNSGDSINIITATSNSGVFDKIYGLDGYTGQGVALNPIFSNTGVSLQATAAEVSSAGVFNSQNGVLADVMIGTGNEQTLVGGGGADVILAGHGKNTVVVGDTAFSYLDGGSGASTLKFNFATGSTIDLTGSGVVGAAGTTSGAHRSDSVENFSVFDLSSSQGSTLNLNDSSVFSASAVNNSLVSSALGATAASHALVVVGGSANTVNFSGAGSWHQDANAVNLTVNGTTDSYTVVHGTHNGQNETVYVQHDVHVGLPPP